MRTAFKKDLSPSARILLVDDDQGLREEFIESFDEFTIAQAKSGEEAIQILKNLTR